MKVVPFQTWTRIKGTFVSPLRDEPLPSITAEYRTRSEGVRVSLIRYVARDLSKLHGPEDEDARIEQVRFLLAALPESAVVVRRLLDRPNAPLLKEVHFSLFCFMPEVMEVDGARVFARSVPRLVRNYLFRVRDDRASAAWMAADLIGDHWTKKDGLRVLVDVLHRARFAPAREAAIHGIRMLYPRLTRAEKLRVRRSLERAGEKDRNRGVRHRSSALLDQLPSLSS